MAILCRRGSGTIFKKYRKCASGCTLAALACVAEKKRAWELVSQKDGANVADDYVVAMERRYIDRLSVDVMEMRLR